MIEKTKPVLEENIKEIYAAAAGDATVRCLKVADLGCSSGPNTLAVILQMLEAIADASAGLNRDPPALQVFLNDLPVNDFNSLFQSLPRFYEEVMKKIETEAGGRLGRCFIFGAPGSFYGSLFPNNTMHFFYSCYSLQWLSRVSRKPFLF